MYGTLKNTITYGMMMRRNRLIESIYATVICQLLFTIAHNICVKKNILSINTDHTISNYIGILIMFPLSYITSGEMNDKYIDYVLISLIPTAISRILSSLINQSNAFDIVTVFTTTQSILIMLVINAIKNPDTV